MYVELKVSYTVLYLICSGSYMTWIWIVKKYVTIFAANELISCFKSGLFKVVFFETLVLLLAFARSLLGFVCCLLVFPRVLLLFSCFVHASAALATYSCFTPHQDS